MGSHTHTLEYHLLTRLENKLAERSMGKYQFNLGAIVTDKKGQILSYGFNSYQKTHPKQYLYNKGIRDDRIYLHAEIDSLIKCSTMSHAAHMLIVARLGKDGRLHMAKPCAGCMKAIKESHIKYCYYTNDNGELVLIDN